MLAGSPVSGPRPHALLTTADPGVRYLGALTMGPGPDVVSPLCRANLNFGISSCSIPETNPLESVCLLLARIAEPSSCCIDTPMRILPHR